MSPTPRPLTSAITLALTLSLPHLAHAALIPELQTQAASLDQPPRSRLANSTPLNQFTQADEPEDLNPLNLEARIGVSLDSGPGVGYGSTYGSFYAFVPFSQTPEQRTFFGEGRVNLLAQGEVGSNIRLGYRQHLPESDLVVGGHLGYDLRNTEFSETFHQIGLGAEVMGQRWEARLNGYLPIGDTRRQVAFADSGTLISNLQFRGNNLFFDRFRQQTQTFEAAAAGLDLEGGYQLADWESGSLYGYLGTYYLNVPSEGGYLGVRGRLLAELSEVLSAGVAVSTDGNFGTNFTLQLAATFGGRPVRQQGETPAESVVARLGQPVQRREMIAIDRQQENTIEQAQAEIARNPATGQPWRFLHVTDGAAGNGTFESPFGEVTDAVAVAQTAGNDVVYVDAGDRSGMDGFAIPDNVQVLSTGVTQFLDLVDVGNRQLPGSGTGTLPLLDGTLVPAPLAGSAMVSMNDNSRLSGFEIRTGGTLEFGIFAGNVSRFNIDRNTISTTGINTFGILAFANAGTLNDATISGNTI
ncbi:MAG: hypothetical protein HC910_22965, partial [Spirulinaceae cyanobacterium SM2_1_0]|nr:hypothetical protein [Spirulinaceae cyanobacterium SM2_1_0]